MKNMLLVSSFVEVLDAFKTFAGMDYVDKIVTFVPTASAVEDVNYYVNTAMEEFRKLGLIVDVLDISTASYEEIKGELENTHFIYFSGGNSFFLLQELRRTGADKILIGQIKSGKPFIGESAGAVILAKDIGYMSSMDDPNKAPSLGASFEGLGMIDFCPVPHNGNFPYQETVHNIVSNHGEHLLLRPFSNSEAIVVKGDQFEVVHA